MQRPETTELFTYFRNIDFALDVLKQKRVFFCRAQSFNDPFDGSIPFEIDFDPSEFIASAHRTYQKERHTWDGIKKILDTHIDRDGTLLESTKKTVHSTAEGFREHNNNIGLFCLSEESLSVLMWSHYAHKHQGLCIGFNRSEDSDLGDDDACNPIVYSDIYPTARFSQLYRGDASLTKDILFTKARDWAYEKEWRMVSEKGDFYAKIPGEISKVILGCRFDNSNIDQIKNICKAEGISLLRAHQVPRYFALELKPE